MSGMYASQTKQDVTKRRAAGMRQLVRLARCSSQSESDWPDVAVSQTGQMWQSVRLARCGCQSDWPDVAVSQSQTGQM